MNPSTQKTCWKKPLSIWCCFRAKALTIANVNIVPPVAGSFRSFRISPATSALIGLAHDWEFESKCWILSHLEQVTDEYRQEFIKTFDLIFSYWMDDFDSYEALSEEVREHYLSINKRIPLLHRNGFNYLISPKDEKMRKINLQQMKAHPPYI